MIGSDTRGAAGGPGEATGGTAPPHVGADGDPAAHHAASDEAIEWLARLRATDVTDAERADFAEWLAQPGHKRAFDAALALWEHLDSVDLSSEPVPTRRRDARRRIRRVAPLALAATVLLSALAWLLVPGTVEYRTAVGEQRLVTLEDSSRVHLNTDSAVAVRYRGAARSVTLIGGEAWFDVSHDAARPFTVSTARVDVTALGTAFAVRETPGFTRVDVAEGTVAVRRRDAAPADPEPPRHLVGAGERGAFTEHGGSVARHDVAASLAWTEGRLIYRDVRLADLVADLNRYVPQAMTLKDDALADLPVSAVLHLGDQEAMLDALQAALPLRWSAVDSLIILHADQARL